MVAYDDKVIDGIERHIAETSEHIEVQRGVVRNYHAAGHLADAGLAEGILRALEKSLSILEERRRMEFLDVRGPRRASKSQPTSNRRKSRG